MLRKIKQSFNTTCVEKNMYRITFSWERSSVLSWKAVKETLWLLIWQSHLTWTRIWHWWPHTPRRGAVFSASLPAAFFKRGSHNRELRMKDIHSFSEQVFFFLFKVFQVDCPWFRKRTTGLGSRQLPLQLKATKCQL